MYAPEITQYINTTLEAKLFKGLGARMSGLAELIETGEGKQTVPALIDVTGEGKYVGVDDAFPLSIYHRLVQPVSVSPTKKGFGNDRWETATAKMRLVVFYPKKNFEKDLKLFGQQLQQNLPRRATDTMRTDLRVKSVRITPGDFVANTPVVFKDEYNFPLSGRTDLAMGALHYTVEVLYNPACIPGCAC